MTIRRPYPFLYYMRWARKQSPIFKGVAGSKRRLSKSFLNNGRFLEQRFVLDPAGNGLSLGLATQSAVPVD